MPVFPIVHEDPDLGERQKHLIPIVVERLPRKLTDKSLDLLLLIKFLEH